MRMVSGGASTRGSTTQYWLMASVWLGHFLPRLALPVIVPMIAKDLAATTTQRAVLLSSFFRGYLVTQVVGGLIAQRVGGKIVLTVDLIGMALAFGSLPMVVKSGGGRVRGAQVALAVMGAFMGPLLAASSTTKNKASVTPLFPSSYTCLPFRPLLTASAVPYLPCGTHSGSVGWMGPTKPWLKW